MINPINLKRTPPSSYLPRTHEDHVEISYTVQGATLFVETIFRKHKILTDTIPDRPWLYLMGSPHTISSFLLMYYVLPHMGKVPPMLGKWS